MKPYTKALPAILAAAAALLAAPPLVAAPREPAAAQTSADAELESRVRGALGASLGKPAQEIGVSARNGTVMLFGAVRTASARDSAARATEKVLGVRTVVNALTIVRGS